MTGDYPFSSIQLNGRFIELSAISTGAVEAKSSFEKETLSFIQDWLNGKEHFTLHTSGSTGTPKLITVRRDQMIASANATAKALQLKTNDTSLLCIDSKYIGGKMMLVRAFVVGMQITAVEPEANPLEKIPRDQCVNFAAFVPYQVQHILVSNGPHSFDPIKKLIIGGSALPPSTTFQLQSVNSECYATYGMTETISHIALQQLNGHDKQQYFHTLPGIVLQTDERGCLIINAPYIDHPVVTNDLVELINKEAFYITGRWDNVINSGGYKVIPEKVEATIQKILDDTETKMKFFISGISDPVLGQKVVMVVEANSHTVENFLRFFELLRSSVHRYEVPKAILLSGPFLYTETGKINRLQSLNNIQKIIETRDLSSLK
jgi:o-succinylbenzoate---CoA ligase